VFSQLRVLRVAFGSLSLSASDTIMEGELFFAEGRPAAHSFYVRALLRCGAGL